MISPPRPKANRYRIWVFRLAALAISSFLGLLFCEAALRVVGVWPLASEVEEKDESLLSSNSDFRLAQVKGWIPWPEKSREIALDEHPVGKFTTARNEFSLRTERSVNLKKDSNTFRILVLGDSHAQGYCNESETFSARLEAKLNEVKPLPDMKFEVLNGAFVRASPYQEYWAYEKAYRLLEPDLILVVLFSGNDMIDLLRRDERVFLDEVDGRLAHHEPEQASNFTEKEAGIWSGVKGFMRSSSSTYTALTRLSFLRRAVVQTTSDPYRIRLEAAAEKYPGLIWQEWNQEYYFTHHPEEWDGARRRLVSSLRSFKQAALRDKASLVVASVPAYGEVVSQVDSKSQLEVMELLDLKSSERLWGTEATSLIQKSCGEERIDYCDLSSQLRERHAKKGCYYELDQHLNPYGHEVVAELLFNNVLQIVTKRKEESQ